MPDRSGPPEISGRRRPSGELLLEISNRIVSLHKQFYGKGPTKARAFYQDDLVVVLTRGGFSKVEETLRRAGRGAAVMAQRAEFQDTVKGEFSAAIEELTGRRVLAFMSANHQGPDMAAELFVLEPAEAEPDAKPAEERHYSVFRPPGSSPDAA